MKSEISLALAQVANLFSWVIEVFIAWTAPGLLFMSILPFLIPEIKIYVAIFPNFGNLNLFVYAILWPTFFGICLNSIGIIVFDFIAKKINFANKIEATLTQQLVNAEIAALDNAFSFLTPEQIAHLNSMRPEDKKQYLDTYWQNLKSIISNDIKKRLNAGISLSPHISSLLPDLKKEIRATASAPLSLHVFSLGILGILLCVFLYIIMVSLFCHDWLGLFYKSIAILPLLMVFLYMVFRFAAVYLSTLYSVFVGIGGASRTRKI